MSEVTGVSPEPQTQFEQPPKKKANLLWLWITLAIFLIQYEVMCIGTPCSRNNLVHVGVFTSICDVVEHGPVQQ